MQEENLEIKYFIAAASGGWTSFGGAEGQGFLAVQLQMRCLGTRVPHLKGGGTLVIIR